jgi:DNA-directed RNA polymerase subunit RPC12/RpoP
MNCPECGSTRVFPSRVRNIIERLRQILTDKQPYRCHQCGWRKWRDVLMHPENPDVRPDDLRTGRVSTPVSANDFDQLDTTAPKSKS